MIKQRLMIITHDLAIGGLQKIVVTICRTIDRERFDVSVLCLRALGEFASDVEKLGIEVILLPQKHSGVDYFSFIKVAKILRQRKIDVIHTHNTQPLIDGTLGALLAGVKTIVHTDHAREFPDKKRYMFAEWLLSHAVYRMVGVSEPTTRDLMEHEKISPHKVMTIVNGIDATHFAVTVDKQEKRRELGIKGKGPVIGLGVRLSREKGVEYLLQAMSVIIQRYPDITLLIAGKGDRAKDLERQAVDLGIEHHTMFLGPRLDIPEVLSTLDLYVLPSLREGLPTILLEAMAAGCPIVATRVGGSPTVIDHNENGSLVESKDPEALAAEIIRVLGDEQLRNRYIQKGQSLVRSKFTAAAMTAAYEKLYLGKQATAAQEDHASPQLMQR